MVFKLESMVILLTVHLQLKVTAYSLHVSIFIIWKFCKVGTLVITKKKDKNLLVLLRLTPNDINVICDIRRSNKLQKNY